MNKKAKCISARIPRALKITFFKWNLKIPLSKDAPFKCLYKTHTLSAHYSKNNIGMNIDGTHLKLVGKLKAATSSIIYHGFRDSQKIIVHHELKCNNFIQILILLLSFVWHTLILSWVKWPKSVWFQYLPKNVGWLSYKEKCKIHQTLMLLTISTKKQH